MSENNRTPIIGRSKKEVDDLSRKLQAKIDPWKMHFYPDAPPFKMQKFDGSWIHSQGLTFSGSIRDVFWGGFIEPFIEAGIIESLDLTVKSCRESGIPADTVIDEKAALLANMIKSVYQHMANVDHTLLTSGHQLKANPPSVLKRDVTGKTERMLQFLGEQVVAAKALVPAQRSDEPPTKTEDPLPAKPPVILQKIKWFWIYGLHYWSWIAIGIIVLAVIWVGKQYLLPSKSGNTTPSQQNLDPMTPEQVVRPLVLELRTLTLRDVGDLIQGDRNPTRIEVYVDNEKIQTGTSLDVYRMRNRKSSDFNDGEHVILLRTFAEDFTPFEIRLDIVDVDEADRPSERELMGRFVFTVRPSDLGKDLRPAGSEVANHGDKNASLTLRIDWREE